MNFLHFIGLQNFFKKLFCFKFVFVLFFVSLMLLFVSATPSYNYIIDDLKSYQMQDGSITSSPVATAYSLLVFYDLGYSKNTEWDVKKSKNTFKGGIQQIINWVLKNQKVNGSWANDPRTTAIMIKGLVNYGIKGKQIDNAIEYLKTKDSSKSLMNSVYATIGYGCVNELCNKAYNAMAFEAVGDPKAIELFAEFKDLQFKYDSRESIYSDMGGWGKNSDSFSKANLVSTISILYALNHTKALFDKEAAKAFMLSNQSIEGGWSPNLTGRTIEETSLAIFNLSKLGSEKNSPEIIKNMSIISGISDSVKSFENVLFFSIAFSGYSKIASKEPLKPKTENYYPVPDFSVTPELIFVGKEITFDASGSTDDTGIVNYIFNFGDKKTAEGKIVKHTFLQDGVFSVKLTVIDNFDAKSTITKKIVVKNTQATMLAAKLIDNKESELGTTNSTGELKQFNSTQEGSKFNVILFVILIIVLITIAIIVIKHTDLI